MYLAIDPGNDRGYCYLDPNRCILRVGLGDPYLPGILLGVIIEKPQIYTAAKSKGNPNDLISVAIDVGRMVERFGICPRVELVTPATWKGQVPKDVHHARIWGALNAKEQDLVSESLKGVAPSKRHNVMDAIGLARWAVTEGPFRAS